MKKWIQNIKSAQGFTLIEVVVVCVILSVLMAITVPAGMRYIEKKKADQCEANRKSLVLYLETARIDNPEEVMGNIIIAHKEISCPSGGTYSAVDSNTVVCNKHGEDYTLSADAGESIASVSPANPGEITETATPTNTPTVIPSETPIETPTNTPIETPTNTPIETPTNTPSETPVNTPTATPTPGTKDDADDEFQKFSGDFEELWKYAKDLESGNDVGEWSPYTIFRDDSGAYIMMLNTRLPLKCFNKNHDKIQGMSQGKKQDYVVLNLDKIVDGENDNLNKNYSAGTVAYYDGKYYAAKEKTSGAKPGSYPWEEIKDQGSWTPLK